MTLSAGVTIAFISLTVSIFALVVSFFNWRSNVKISNEANNPAILHSIDHLPPYNSEVDNSRIRVKNVGTAKADIVSIYIKFSWDKDLQQVLYEDLDNPEEYFFLSPNEEKVFYKRLPEPPRGKKIYIEITTEYDKELTKTDKIEMFIPKTSVDFGM